ncbi:hypothetical protein AAVH_32810 [Aphelenchoides avenae]|nr:hypothetical protein AAVH_32810 [Aphelenchus avenae]
MMKLTSTVFAMVVIHAVCGTRLEAPTHHEGRDHGSVTSLLVGTTAKMTQPVTRQDTQFYVNISIGTPPQVFFTQISTTTSYSWVPDSSCLCPSICSSAFACFAGYCDDTSECCDEDFTNSVAKPHSRNGTSLRAFTSHQPGYGECNTLFLKILLKFLLVTPVASL